MLKNRIIFDLFINYVKEIWAEIYGMKSLLDVISGNKKGNEKIKHKHRFIFN